MKVEATPRATACGFFVITMVLAIAHLASLALFEFRANRYTREFVRMFSLDGDGNFPAFYSGLLLLIAAILFGLLSKGERAADAVRRRKYWVGLGLLFALLATDKMVHFHTILSYMIWWLRATADLPRWPLRYGMWAIVLAITAIYARFWMSLPGRRFRFLFALAALLYVSAGLGLESIASAIHRSNRGPTPTYVAISFVEEVMEMLAIVLLIYTIMLYLAKQSSSLQIQFVHRAADDSARDSRENAAAGSPDEFLANPAQEIV